MLYFVSKIFSMHTVDYEFICTGKRNHINIRGEVTPPADQAAPAVVKSSAANREPRRRPVFLILTIVCAFIVLGGLASLGSSESLGTTIFMIVLHLVLGVLFGLCWYQKK